MVRVKLVSKYPISYAINREKLEITADGKSGFVSVTSKADIASDKFVVESEYIEVRESVSFGKKIPSDGLIAEYLFFEGSGTVLHETLNGYDGTIYGARWEQFATGKYCLSFDGFDDYVGTSLTYDKLEGVITHELAIITWVYPINGPHIGVSGYLAPDWKFSAIVDMEWCSPISLRIVDAEGHIGVSYKYASDGTLEDIISDLVAINKEWQMMGYWVSLEDREVVIFRNDEFWTGTTSRGTEDELKIAGKLKFSGFPDNTWLFKGKMSLAYIYCKKLSEKYVKKVFKATAPLFGIEV